jgi:hypothetical protein
MAFRTGLPSFAGRRSTARPGGADSYWAHADRISDLYADERIDAKIASLGEDRARENLLAYSEELKAARLPPAARLHLVYAIAHLGETARTTLSARCGRSFRALERWENEGGGLPP